MITEEPVLSSDEDNITVFHKGRLVGVVSAKYLSNVKKLRLVFTRNTPQDAVEATQGQCLEVF